jgi:hypothetical protein
MPRSKKAPVENTDVVMLDENDELPELIDIDSAVDINEEEPAKIQPIVSEMTVVKNRKRRAKNADVFMEDVEEKQSDSVEPVIPMEGVILNESQFEAKQEAALKSYGNCIFVFCLHTNFFVCNLKFCFFIKKKNQSWI